MGKTRLFAVIVALLIVAVLAVLLLPDSEAGMEKSAPEKETLVTVVAAGMEIPAYTLITEDMLRLVELPEGSIHENSVFDPAEVAGFRTLVPMAPGEVILSNHIFDPEAPENRLAYKIGEGMRAMTLPVDDTTGVCDLIRAGDRVDVLVAVQDVEKEEPQTQNLWTEGGSKTPKQDKNSGRILALPVLQDVRVLALDQDMFYAPQGEAGLICYRQVTLELAAEDTVKLTWAQYEGKVFLALRGENDDEIIAMEPYGAVKALSEGESD